MASSVAERRQIIIKFVQEMLLDQADRSSITPALIERQIEELLKMKPSWGEGVDRGEVVDELIRRFSIWIGDDTTLVSDVGHVPWLTANRKEEWRYWQRYREWLERRLSFLAIEGLNESSDRILALLEDPWRESPWDRRGLVVGHVQSGKTANYTGLICKAADAGYKIIIVLAGLHNNLRSQTQMRLDEGFLGFETNPVASSFRVIGVGEIDSDPAIRPNFATNRADNGDFNLKGSRHLGISPEQRPWLFVVKKNKSVLNNLYGWIRDHVTNSTEPQTGLRVVTQLPLLLIDDEADHASVDTGEEVIGSDGLPDDEHQPTAINSGIRKLLRVFTHSAYVGYTATPFANIFIHERGETTAEGPDLFPSSFIINLATPSSYVGPAIVFGRRLDDGFEPGLPLVREVADFASADGSGWMPQKHKSSHIPYTGTARSLPNSVIEAVDAFLLACAERKLRGQGGEHSSMLIHVTRFVAVQGYVHEQVLQHLQGMRQRIARRIDDQELLERLENLWQRDFIQTNAALRDAKPDLNLRPAAEWKEILYVLPTVVSEIEVRAINGSAKDALDYAEHSSTGLKVIAIGGDKLARGLTLEGLCVSYFLRASKMYDTLMQMGRWFGYRPGYLDLCRLYTTEELTRWFRHITDAAEELREEFDMMAASGATPREYGLKVQSHPTLLVTSRLKMRSARSLFLSFSGDVVETVSLFRDVSELRRNVAATETLLGKLGPGEPDPVRTRGDSTYKWKGYLWQGTGFEAVTEFLTSYRTHPDAHKVNSVLLTNFIESMAATGELTSWTVGLLGSSDARAGDYTFSSGHAVSMIRRKQESIAENRYSIGRLLSTRDEAIDLNEAEWQAALEATKKAWHSDPGRLKERKDPDQPSGIEVRRIRGFGAQSVQAHPERGLLLIYAIDPARVEAGFAPDTPPIIGFGISFPGSNAGVKVEYKVNHVLWEQEYGPSE